MKNLIRLVPLLLFLAFPSASPLNAADTAEKKNSIAGTWTGTLEIFGQELPLVFKIELDPLGRYSGVLQSPTQSPIDIPITTVTVDDRNVAIAVDSVKGTYKGKLSSTRKSIRGDWSQGGNSLPLKLEFSVGGFVYVRPQDPKPPFPYDSTDVSIPNKLGSNVLAGTLTRPKKPMRPVPAVVLVSGSGPQDRDEFLAGHRPFAVIADYLTRKGIAVLRYDDRGTGKSTGKFEYGTTLDFATDAYAAVEFLKKQKDIDPGKVGIIGHSEGGMIAPIVVTKREDIAFIVLLAGPGLRGDQTILSQSKALGEAAGLPQDFINLNQEFSRAIFEIVNQTQPDLAKAEALAIKFQKDAKAMVPDIENIGGAADFGKMIGDQLKQLETPWFRNFLKLDPGEYLQKTTCPVLALNGELDLQVIPDLHLPAIEGHLNSAGNKNVTVKELKGLNHLFQRAETGQPNEYAKIEETIATSVLKLIADWIAETAKM